MANQIKAHILLSYDSYEAWEAVKDTFKPLKGQVCIVNPNTQGQDTSIPCLMKVGDGERIWKYLPWISATAADVYEWAKAAEVEYNEYQILFKDTNGEVVKSVDLTNLVDDYHKKIYGYCGEDLLIIPEGTTEIAEDAYATTNYKCVVIPNSVTMIGNSAFYACYDLESVIMGSGVKIIDNGAFTECMSLRSISIPNSVTTIGDYAFEWCTSLTSVVIGDSVTSIGKGAFGSCSSLTSVVIPDSVTYIGSLAFAGDSLKTIEFKGNNIIYSIDSILEECYNIQHIIVPVNVVDSYKETYTGLADKIDAYVTKSYLDNNFTAPGTQVQIITWEDGD